MEDKETGYLKPPTLQIILAAGTITFLSYLTNNIKVKDIVEFFNLITSGLPLLKNEIFTADFYANLPISPIIIVWFIIGVVAYLNYYSLNVVYCNIYNYLVLKFNFTKPRDDGYQFLLKKRLRLVIHSLVIISYTALYTLLFTVFLPLGEILRVYIFTSTSFFQNTSYDFTFSYVCLFLYWLAAFGVLGIISEKMKTKIASEELEEEHYQV